MFFSVITKNLKWEILTRNLVTFKRWDGVKDRDYGSLLKSPIFRRLHEKPIHWGCIALKRGLGQFADLRGGLAKKEVKRGVSNLNAHYKLEEPSY